MFVVSCTLSPICAALCSYALLASLAAWMAWFAASITSWAVWISSAVGLALFASASTACCAAFIALLASSAALFAKV